MLGNLSVGAYGLLMNALISRSGYKILGFAGCVAVAFVSALMFTSAPIAFVLLPYLKEKRGEREKEERGRLI